MSQRKRQRELPDVSLVICTYNRKGELERLLKSLLRIEYSGDLDVMVVDDCSSENIVEMIDRFRALQDRFQIRYHRLNSNAGPAVGRNIGAGLCKGDYLWFLDSDTEVRRPSIMTDAMDFFFRFSQVGMLGGEIQPMGGRQYFISYSLFPNMAHSVSFIPLESAPPLEIAKDVLSTSNFFIRRNLFESVGGFGEKYTCLEDVDLSLRVVRRGYWRLISPKTSVTHYHSQSGREGGRFGFYTDPFTLSLAYHGNRIRLLCAHHPRRSKWLVMLDLLCFPLIAIRSLRNVRAMQHVSGKMGRSLRISDYLRGQAAGLFANYWQHYQRLLTGLTTIT